MIVVAISNPNFDKFWRVKNAYQLNTNNNTYISKTRIYVVLNKSVQNFLLVHVMLETPFYTIFHLTYSQIKWNNKKTDIYSPIGYYFIVFFSPYWNQQEETVLPNVLLFKVSNEMKVNIVKNDITTVERRNNK